MLNIKPFFYFICRRLVQGWQQARVPTALPLPDLEVCGAHSVTVKLKDPRNIQPALRDPPIVTKYKGVCRPRFFIFTMFKFMNDSESTSESVVALLLTIVKKSICKMAIEMCL